MSLTIGETGLIYHHKLARKNVHQAILDEVDRELNSYEAISIVFRNVFSCIDPHMEMEPSEIDFEEGKTWDGSAKIYTSVHRDLAIYTVDKIFEKANFRAPEDAGFQSEYYTLFDHETLTEPKELQFTLVRPSLGSLEFDAPLELPMTAKFTPLRDPIRYDDADLPPPLDLEALSDLFITEEYIHERLANVVSNYLASAGELTEPTMKYLNQADWHSILRSMGIVSAASGAVAWGLGGGFIGGACALIASLAGGTQAAVSASDFAQSDEAHEMAKELEGLYTFHQYQKQKEEEARQKAAAAPSPTYMLEEDDSETELGGGAWYHIKSGSPPEES